MPFTHVCRKRLNIYDFCVCACECGVRIIHRERFVLFCQNIFTDEMYFGNGKIYGIHMTVGIFFMTELSELFKPVQCIRLRWFK